MRVYIKFVSVNETESIIAKPFYNKKNSKDTVRPVYMHNHYNCDFASTIMYVLYTKMSFARCSEKKRSVFPRVNNKEVILLV